MLNTHCELLVIGTGLVARSMCYDVALASRHALRIGVIGRNIESVSELVTFANARAISSSTTSKFIGSTIDWESDDHIAETIIKYKPKIIFLTSSLQPPGEFINTPSAWCDLVEQCGFGITLPLQAALAARLAKVMKNIRPSSLLVNACYPDAVNPLLNSLGLPITCGVGNIGFLDALLKATPAWRGKKIQIIIHHADLYANRTPQSLRVWVDGEQQLPEVKINYALSIINRYAEVELDRTLLGSISSQILLALLDSKPLTTHVPGPNGLAGGYPVTINHGKVYLNLPSTCSQQKAISINEQACPLDGVEAADPSGFIQFSPKSSEIINRYSSSLAAGFHINDLQTVAQEFVNLRNKLRKM